MTAISVRQLSFVTAGGEAILSSLDLELPRAVHGLVGRNGSGKSVLARLLIGELTASSGTIVRQAPVGYLPQSPTQAERTLGGALGLAPRLAALSRIESGSVDVADFELIGEDWEFAMRWRQSLAEAGLPDDFARPLDELSGGELTRARLLRLFAEPGHYLVLDEPSNHLDRPARAWLRGKLKAHAGGALVVSHDRELLDEVAAIHELSGTGLAHYGGNYTLYRACNEEEHLAARRHLERAKRELDGLRRDRQRTLDKQQKREQRAQRGDDNIPHIALGMRRQHAEQSEGRLHNEQARRVAAGNEQLKLVRARVEQLAPQRIDLRGGGERGGFALRAENLVPAFGVTRPLNFALRMGERMHLDGRNGSGKSSLLRVLAGLAKAREGRFNISGRRLLIDQHFGLIDPAQSALANLVRLAPGHPRGDYRTFLAGIGLGGDRALSKAGVLSGGERVRLALLALDAAPKPYDLILLDETDNHLDLGAKRLLEDALRDYTGAVLLVSHDAVFVREVGVDTVLDLDGN
jgi:ATPase subunit of ABC transporter with duplicated ATPase domains